MNRASLVSITPCWGSQVRRQECCRADDYHDDDGDDDDDDDDDMSHSLNS